MSKWPYPGDTPLVRARKVAQAYRAHLHAANPDLCAAVDDMARAFGEAWVAPALVVSEDTDAITTRDAADLVNVTEDVIRQWACTPHPDDPSRALLPRFKRRGRQMTYLVKDVRQAAELARRRRHGVAA